MRIHLSWFVFMMLIAASISGCAGEKMIYTNLDKSGELFLTQYTQVFPTLGPCGFARSFDHYTVKIPRITGKLAVGELLIGHSGDAPASRYEGYIQFLKNNRILVDLYRVNNGIKTGLTINGKYKIKVEANKLGDQKI